MQPNLSKSNSDASRRTNTIVAWLIGPAFLVLMLWFMFGASDQAIPLSPTAVVSPADISIAPRFEIQSDPPLAVVNTFERTCTDCHSLFEANPQRSQDLMQHGNIVLDHGLNNRCMNCHHADDRSKLVLMGGDPVGYDRVELMCGQCHGTTLRQWQHGVHGKTLGYWDTGRGAAVRLKCTQCHDPHSPGYDPIAPLPGPNTLRMGEVDAAERDRSGVEERERNPLRPNRVDRLGGRHQPEGPAGPSQSEDGG